MYGIRLLDAAAKQLQQLDPTVARRTVRRMQWLGEHFDEISPEALTGELSGLFKFRVGDYRFLYEVLESERVIVVHFVGHRRDIYRRP